MQQGFSAESVIKVWVTPSLPSRELAAAARSVELNGSILLK
jgi:hypothetical protein